MNLSFLSGSFPPKDYWNKKVIHFKNEARFASSLPNIEELIRSFTGSFVSGDWSDPLSVDINASLVDEKGVFQQMLSIGIEEAQKAYRNGFSLCFGDLSDTIPSLSRLKTESIKYFGYEDLIAITGYLSPTNAVGVLHFDRQHNFFIQTQGTKRWFVSERPAIKNPYQNLVYAGTPKKFFDDMRDRGYEILLPRECGKGTYDLSPGDVLYVPPGYYHSPETTGDASLHYTLTVEPACFWKDLNAKLADLMLSNNGLFFEDYRFLESGEKSRLYEECFQIIDQGVLKSE
jgi:ribosomal protein L16 Arg81 hydroxylase